MTVMRGRFARLLDEALGEADVAVDTAQRDLANVVERVRRLGPDVRRTLRAAVEQALADFEVEWRAFEARAEERIAKIAEWREKREQALRYAPELVPQVDERIAALTVLPDEENEYRAYRDDLERVLAVIDG